MKSVSHLDLIWRGISGLDSDGDEFLRHPLEKSRREGRNFAFRPDSSAECLLQGMMVRTFHEAFINEPDLLLMKAFQLPREKIAKVYIRKLDEGVMDSNAINLEDKFALFSEHWSPKIIAQMNDVQFKLVKVKGDFLWHHHPDTDETFLVLDGKMYIDFESGRLRLKKGELFVVKQGVEHKPWADEECLVMVIEPVGTLNTGDKSDPRTVDRPEWI